VTVANDSLSLFSSFSHLGRSPPPEDQRSWSSAEPGFVLGPVVTDIPGLAVLIIYVGTLPCRPLERLHRLGDPSYGMYLSGFALQQFLVLPPPTSGGPIDPPVSDDDRPDTSAEVVEAAQQMTHALPLGA